MEERKSNRPKNIPEVYSEAFKRKVIKEYLDTGFSKMSIQTKYKIAFKSAICTWMKRLGYEDIYAKRSYFEVPNHFEMKKNNPHGQAGEKEDIESLKNRVKELERELENAQLRSEAYRLTIEIAEKELNIPIRKKRSTK